MLDTIIIIQKEAVKKKGRPRGFCFIEVLVVGLLFRMILNK